MIDHTLLTFVCLYDYGIMSHLIRSSILNLSLQVAFVDKI